MYEETSATACDFRAAESSTEDPTTLDAWA